jgi:hypothetical protein
LSRPNARYGHLTVVRGALVISGGMVRIVARLDVGGRRLHPGSNGTMTNGGVGQTVSSVDGPVLTVKYRDGEKKIIVGPSVPVTRLEVANKSELKSGVAVAAQPLCYLHDCSGCFRLGTCQ